MPFEGSAPNRGGSCRPPEPEPVATRPTPPPPAPTGEQVVVASRTTTITVVMGVTTMRTITAVTAVMITTMTITAAMGRTTIEPALHPGPGWLSSSPALIVLHASMTSASAAGDPVEHTVVSGAGPDRGDGSVGETGSPGPWVGLGIHRRRDGAIPTAVSGTLIEHGAALTVPYRRPMSRFEQGRWNRILVWTGAALAWGSALVAACSSRPRAETSNSERRSDARPSMRAGDAQSARARSGRHPLRQCPDHGIERSAGSDRSGAGPGAGDDEQRIMIDITFPAMGTGIDAWCPDPESAAGLRRWFEEVETVCSRFRPGSELSRMNRSADGQVVVSASSPR